MQKSEALCTNLSLYSRNANAYYALISSSFIKKSKTRSIAFAKLEKKVNKIYARILIIEAKYKKLDLFA